jgi:hypothetical protein
VFGNQIKKNSVRLGPAWRQRWWCARLNVVEILADELRIGDICNHVKLPAAQRPEGDVYFEAGPGQRCGGRIGAIGSRFVGVLAGRQGRGGVFGLSSLP